MNIEQIYTKCLAQGAYYIVSENEAAIIDPLRETQPYLDRLERDGVRLKYIFETHFHADFVSGHLSLAEKTQATIVYGPTAEPHFHAHIAKDGEIFSVGKIRIKALHTPGHTMESTSYLLSDETGKDIALFSGDTLFLGDVGRPDLAQSATGLSCEDLAGILFESLRQKIMPLADDILVYPAHGAGSACGKNMSQQTVDTLGNQKRTNYALRANMTKEEFIAEVTDGIPQPPAYFPLNADLNRRGYTDFDTVLQKGLQALSVKDFQQKMSEALVLDVREVKNFAQSHIPGSVFIGLRGDFAPWVGTILKDVSTPLLLVTEEGDQQEAVTRLARVGFDRVLGFLQGGISSWIKAQLPTDSVTSISAQEFEKAYHCQPLPVIDVRKENEFCSSHLENAQHCPLSYMENHISSLKDQAPFYLHCAGGYRSMIAASLLKKEGIRHFFDIQGGFQQIKNTSLKINHLKSCQ